jgi:phosphatidylinositol alpha-mannosyltransferase
MAPSTGLWATLEARAPVVGTFHSGATRARLYDLAAPLLRRAAAHLTVRIAVSERAADFERARIGGEFRIIPNGVDVARFAEAEPADLGPGRKLLFVGRLDERKGFPVAVEAFERLAADRPDVHLVVVGDGPQRNALDRLPTMLRARVTMLGAVPNEELPPIHAACDLYLGPSTGGESFGIVLVEAMAAGATVLASDIPAFRRVLEEGTYGVLFTNGDVADLTAKLTALLDDPGRRTALDVAARTAVRRYDWSAVAGQILRVYETVVARGVR